MRATYVVCVCVCVVYIVVYERKKNHHPTSTAFTNTPDKKQFKDTVDFFSGFILKSLAYPFGSKLKHISMRMHVLILHYLQLNS